MDTKELLGLMEAYTEVYASEEEIDEERAPGVKPYRPSPTQAEVRANEKAASKKKAAAGSGKSGYGPDEKFKKPDDRIKKPGTEVPPVQKYGRIFKNIPHGIGAHATRTISANTRVRGEDPGAPRSQKIARTMKMVKTKDGWKKVRAEEFDAYDIILMHLLDEGYAPNPDAAEAIMVNMSEEWIESILG